MVSIKENRSYKRHDNKLMKRRRIEHLKRVKLKRLGRLIHVEYLMKLKYGGKSKGKSKG